MVEAVQGDYPRKDHQAFHLNILNKWRHTGILYKGQASLVKSLGNVPDAKVGVRITNNMQMVATIFIFSLVLISKNWK